MFCAWLELSDAGQTPATPPLYPCADAVMYYARNQQGPDMRGGVTADTAWELCCRTLSELVDIHSLSSRALAQLLMYWPDGDETSPGSPLPVAMREIIYGGMLADLTERGKEIRSEADEAVMKSERLKKQIRACLANEDLSGAKDQNQELMDLLRRSEGDRPCASSSGDSRPCAAAPATSREEPLVDPPGYVDRVSDIFNKDPY